MRLRSFLMVLGLLCAAAVPAAKREADHSITVYAASSLKEVVDAIAKDFSSQSGVVVKISYAGSAILARQIEHGAPADIIITADQAWMDYLDAAGRIVPAKRRIIAANRLVLIAPADKICEPFDLRSTQAWLTALDSGRLSLAETSSVPAGRYAQQSLQHLGVWSALQHRLAESDNVRAAMAFVAQGEAPLGIVYATDALAEPRVCVRATFDANGHSAIVYPAAVVKSARAQSADAFFEYLASEPAQKQFQYFGFSAFTP